MLNRFLAFISEKQLVRSVQPWLLAVSGGMDSVCLADLLKKAGISFAVAHCNFGLRGDESDGDEAFVIGLARHYDVPVFVEHFDTETYAATHKLSIQQAARELRYNWFETIRSGHHFSCIATAHHLSDVAETIWINQLRGTGIEGLHGIRAVHGHVVRPLLFATRNEIRTYIESEGLAYREDSSNYSDKYLRNAIRHHVMPQVLQIAPDAETTMAENAGRISRFEQLAGQLITERWRGMTRQHPDGIYIDIAKLSEAFPDEENLREFLYQALKPFGFNADTAILAGHLISSQPGKTVYSRTHSLLKDRDCLILSPLQDDIPPPVITIHRCPQNSEVIDGLSFHIIPAAGVDMTQAKPGEAYMDLSTLVFPLTIRRWEQGDVMRPLGMTGSKKISDILTDHKVPLSVKKDTRVMVSGNHIVWLVGMRVDDRFKVSKKTSTVLKISLQNLYSPEYQI